jgi:outer membrane protein
MIVKVDESLRGLELGQRTNLDLLNIQRERYKVERNLAAARYEYLPAYL